MTGVQFLAAKLRETQAELSVAILNRRRWDVLCDNRRMLVFLQGRAGAVDFEGVRTELRRIAQGQIKVPDITGPRRKADDCLQAWAKDLEALD